jgi:hypothetical protein
MEFLDKVTGKIQINENKYYLAWPPHVSLASKALALRLDESENYVATSGLSKKIIPEEYIPPFERFRHISWLLAGAFEGISGYQVYNLQHSYPLLGFVAAGTLVSLGLSAYMQRTLLYNQLLDKAVILKAQMDVETHIRAKEDQW